MTPIATLSLLMAGPEETTLRFKSMPPLWTVFMVIVPAVIIFVWWLYRREGDTATRRVKRILAVLRIAAILLVILLLFQPYAETSVKNLVKSHLVVLLDTSASMEFIDTYEDPGRREQTRKVAGLGPSPFSKETRLTLVKGVLANADVRLLDRLAERFHMHVYTFDAGTSLLASSAELSFSEDEVPLATRIKALRATGAYTFFGDSIVEVIDEFRLRDEPLAGIVLFTDGRQNGGTVGPLEAARKAASARPKIPLFVVGVGDPDLPRNIHVGNLRAKEVVLRGDDVGFEFTVTHKGYRGEALSVQLLSLDAEGEVEEELSVSNRDVVLGEEGVEQAVRVSHRFLRPGSYTLSVGIPVQKGEKIENDNFLVHHLRVVDKKIKVLYVEGYPRWEYRFLKEGLTRDTETILAHVVNLDADPDVVQPYSAEPGWRPLQQFPTTKEELYEYDVVIFGDVDWQQLNDDEAIAKRALENLKAFVEDGGGFIMIAGPYDSPRSYRSTPIRDILPVVLNLDEELRVSRESVTSFNLKLTPDGREHPIMQLTDEAVESRQIWEKDKFSAQFWYYPVERAKSTATELAVHPGEYNRNKFGPHVIMATMRFDKGRTLFVAVDELWRLRWSFGDRYHYRFYSEAIRFLATYKLLSGNRRFKIFTDKNRYFVGDTVTISADVYDRDFKPATDETQSITLRSPSGEEQDLTLKLVPNDPGNYRLTVTVNQEGTYSLTALTADDEEERPKKRFKVEYSTEEMRNPLIDLDAMQEAARESTGRFLSLSEVAELPDSIPPKSVFVSSEVRSEDLWDDAWVLFVFTAILGAEWLIRKRYRLL